MKVGTPPDKIIRVMQSNPRRLLPMVAVWAIVATFALASCGGDAPAATAAVVPPPSAPPSAPDTSAPSAPANVSAAASSSVSIRVTWSAASDNVGVAGYRIFRDGNQIGTATGTTYDDSGLTPGTTYRYEVAAYDAAGNVSARSAPASASTPAASGRVITAGPSDYL
ncbi:MAG: fibronectin type III domain-containing protein, partial [Burkholderiaceae bacterium]